MPLEIIQSKYEISFIVSLPYVMVTELCTDNILVWQFLYSESWGFDLNVSLGFLVAEMIKKPYR